MTNHQQLKLALENLANLQNALRENGGPSSDGNLFEQILNFQDEILKTFGLPNTLDNEKLMWFSQQPVEAELNERIKQLHERATNYLLSSTKTNLQTLHDAIELQEDPFTILPELKVTTHTYTLFVYEEMLLKGRDTPENVLFELHLVNRPDVLQAIGSFEQDNFENNRVYQMLKAQGLRYLDAFISKI